MIHNALCCSKSLNWFSALSDGEGYDIRTLIFLTGFADLGTEQRELEQQYDMTVVVAEHWMVVIILLKGHGLI